MTDTVGDESGDERFQFRRHLSVIKAQTELFLDETEPAAEREGLQRIQASCRELTALVEERSCPDAPRILPEAAIPTTVDRIVLYTDDPYLSAVLDTDPDRYAGVDLVHVTDDATLQSALTDGVDWLLVDAVRSDGTGLDTVANLDIEQPAYALVSLYSADRTPAAIACSGLLSPMAGASTIDDVLQAHTDTASPTVAGFLTDQPGSALADRLASTPTRIDSPAVLSDHLETADIAADCLCLDLKTYRQLSSDAIDRLRTPASGACRPIVLVTPTAADPYGRSWIPTLGSRQFQTVAPDLDGLLTQLLVH